MKSWKAVAAVAVIGIFAVSAFALYDTYLAPPQPGCDAVTPGSPLRSKVSGVTFGGVTEYRLPSQGRAPLAITTATDGSVWFAEQEIPGVAHLYPSNGTLVEYAWPGYAPPRAPDCIYSASSSGIALWEGKVWATDQYSNAIFGVDPSDGSTVRVNTTANAAYPYWLAVGPEGDLWFTSDNTPGALGRISPNLTLSVIKLNGIGADEPIQLSFVNSTLAFLAAIDEASNRTTGVCVCTGHIYSFDPSSALSTMNPRVVGGNYTLLLPTSVSYSDDRIWVAQHGPSSVVSYDFSTGQWTKYPTSLVPWSTTLPLVVIADGSTIWFNEHYANKVGRIDASSGTMTEISESSPPAAGPNGIQNDESIALGAGDIWFTSWTGNYVGYVAGGYAPGFDLKAENSTVSIAPGGSATVSLAISGIWGSALGVNASDSETYGSVPKLITVTPSVSTIPAGASSYDLRISLNADRSLSPGRYTVTVTLTEGGVQESAFFFVEVV